MNMLFAFRGIRRFQVLLSLIALVTGIGSVLLLKGFTEGRGFWLLFPAFGGGLAFLWAFATTLRAPTSFVAVAETRTRIRFAGFVDTVVANSDIEGVRLVKRSFLGGLGVRTNFRGDAALISSWGEVAEISLRAPMRVWVVPRLIRVRATRLQVSIKNPSKLVERFPPAGPAAVSTAKSAQRRMKPRGSRTR